MEGVLWNLQYVIVYNDDLLIHSDTHERHRQILEQVLERLQQNHLKINLEKCILGNKEVSYLGFTLTPEGIKPARTSLRQSRPPRHQQMLKQSHPSWDCATSSGPTVQAHPEGLRVQRRALTRSSNGCFYQPQETAHFGVSDGLFQTTDNTP
jgi:Reverse transcriptase (RNA-dependent DNA polymerase)